MANRYWVGGSGTWDNSSTANWSASSGGASGASAPTTSDNVFFDASSGTAATVTVSATAACNESTIAKTDINLTLSGSPVFLGKMTLTEGTINLGSYTLTCGLFVSDNANTRTINFDTGKIVLTSSSGCWDVRKAGFVATGSRRVDSTYSGALSRTIRHGYTVVYTASNAINLYVTAGTGDIVLGQDGNMSVENLDLTGFQGNVVFGFTYIFGDVLFGSVRPTSPYLGLTQFGPIFAATTGPKTITLSGSTISANTVFNGVGGSWNFQDTFTIATGYALTLTNGTVNANNNSVAIGRFALGSGTKTLTLGSGTWTVTDATWNANTNVTNFTVSASTATINMTSASAKTFSGGAKIWPTLNQGGAGTLTIQQSNTFANITNTVQPATITLTSGTTQTVTDFDVSGTSGNLITLNASAAGTRATLTDSGGVNSVSYVRIKDIAATGYGEWQAYTSNGNVDDGNNLGWVFAEPPPLTASEYQISLKSFTERRSF